MRSNCTMEIMLACIHKWTDERKITTSDCSSAAHSTSLFSSFEWVKRKKRNSNTSIKVIGDCLNFSIQTIYLSPCIILTLQYWYIWIETFLIILSQVIHVNLLSTYFCFKTRRTKNIILYKTFSINIESIIISVHCSYMCVYICQHPSNQYWSNIYWDGSFKQDLTFLKNRFLLQVLKQIFVKDSLLRDLSWTTVVCFLKFCKLESKRKANFKCVKNIWISIYM